ncbi:hydrogenase maturation protease, partial [Bacteroidota bacterium]
MANDKALLLGLGSDILSDEGIGIRIIQLLEHTNLRLITDFKTLNIGSPELIEIIKDYKKVFIIDAIKTKSKQVGEIHYLDLNNFQKTINLSNPHDIPFIDTINLGKSIYKEFTS